MPVSEIDIESDKKKQYEWAVKVEPDSISTISLLLPVRFRGKTFENFRGFADKVEMIKGCIKGKESVYITGLCGVGKTHLAAASVYYFHAESGRMEEDGFGEKKVQYSSSIKFLPISEFFLELKSSFDSHSESEINILDKYCRFEFLVIDDVGMEKVSDWSRQVFYTLIDRRYREMRQTLITSNLTLDKLAEYIDERISSRIVEMGKVVTLQGKDMRLKR